MTVAAPAGLPRLLASVRDDGQSASLDEHVARYGAIGDAVSGRSLVELVESSGLRGRGGAAFPSGTKLRAVSSGRRRPVVVVNGVEAEPASGKDRALLRATPHLVLDGAVLAATAVGAREVIVAVGARAAAERATLHAALRERHDGRVSVRVTVVPDAFVAGEETALVNDLNGRPAKPTFTPPRPYERGVDGAPTLVQNVETLAHIALVARYGAGWFRALGTPDAPGSTLVTLGGAVAQPGVYEIAVGTRVDELIQQAGGPSKPLSAFLVGGYFGSWISAENARSLQLMPPDLGAGVVHALPAETCGAVESARLARYLARQSAGQCGPCVRGLDAIAGALELLASLTADASRARRIETWLRQVAGRGACRHPDGTVRFVESALLVFEREFALHRQGRCTGRP